MVPFCFEASLRYRPSLLLGKLILTGGFTDLSSAGSPLNGLPSSSSPVPKAKLLCPPNPCIVAFVYELNPTAPSSPFLPLIPGSSTSPTSVI